MFGIGSTMINEKDGMEMVYVPAGEFEMGSEGADSNQRPVHTVYLDAYWIGKYEVTNQQYAIFQNANGNQTEGDVTWLDEISGYARIQQSAGSWAAQSGYTDHPMVAVNWYGARAYCEWAGGRLPSEAEWDKAARGTDGRTYPWGESIGANFANYGNLGDTTSVGSYPAGASPYGALDMAGNVWEWVQDWYDFNHYSDTEANNPTGPDAGKIKVVRGSSWVFNNVWYLTAAYRVWGNPSVSFGDFGIRCLTSQ